MALQYQLENLDGLDEATAKLYKEAEGGFVLDVTGHEKTDDGDKDEIGRKPDQRYLVKVQHDQRKRAEDRKK